MRLPLLCLLALTSVITFETVLGATPDDLQWSPSDFPDPKRDINLCGRGKPSSICDPDRILTDKGADRIEGTLIQIFEGIEPYKKAPCSSKGDLGFQVAVALMKKMEIPKGQSASEYAKYMAITLHNKWAVGDAACDNGVLLLLSTYDRQAYVSIGKAAEEKLSQSNLEDILESIKPALKAGDYDRAVEEAVVDIGLTVSGMAPHKHHSVDWIPLVFFGGFIYFIVHSVYGSIKKRKELRDCKTLLDKLKDEQENLRSKAWSKPKSCSICLEDFTTSPDVEGGDEDQPTAPLLAPTTTDGAGTSGQSIQDIKHLPGTGHHTERKPMTLPCGHTFCEPCIREWADQAVTCPVCRKPMNDGDTTQQQPSNGAGAAVRGRNSWDDVVAADIAFRLSNVQRRYPTYITPTMADQWANQAQQTGTFEWNRDFQVHSQSMRTQHEFQGSRGFSSSFGGGSASGRGGGASW